MKPYKLALLTGTHQHRWAGDGSGLCEKCSKEHSLHQYKSNEAGVCTICGSTCGCAHSNGFYSMNTEQHRCRECYALLNHKLIIGGTWEDCSSCEECGGIYSHEFANGICSLCGYVCSHEHNMSSNRYWSKIDDDTHRCVTCGLVEGHDMVNQNLRNICQRCSKCGHSTIHTGVSGLGAPCDVCGFVHNIHLYDGGGLCIICGAKCYHTSPDSNGYCSVCQARLVKDGCSYYLFGDIPYQGSYEEVDRVYTNEGNSDKYIVYKGWKWNGSQWVTNGYYMTCFNITNDITQFGGEYAYKISGIVFTATPSINVAPALLEANGVIGLTLAQYNLDGTLCASNMTGYTSADMANKKVSNLPFYSSNWTP